MPPQSCPIQKKKYPKKLSAICPSQDYLLQHCGNCFCTIPQNHFNLDQIFTTHLLVIINSFCRNEMKHRDHHTIFVVNNHHNKWLSCSSPIWDAGSWHVERAGWWGGRWDVHLDQERWQRKWQQGWWDIHLDRDYEDGDQNYNHDEYDHDNE